jgi:hypothetical protein
MEEERESLYVESTIPSYATARESANALNLLRRAQTRAFWDKERHKYDLYVSQAVTDECAKGDPEADGIYGLWTPVLVTPETIYITERKNYGRLR